MIDILPTDPTMETERELNVKEFDLSFRHMVHIRKENHYFTFNKYFNMKCKVIIDFWAVGL